MLRVDQHGFCIKRCPKPNSHLQPCPSQGVYHNMDKTMIKYPRHVVRRLFLRWIACLLVRLLTRLEVSGQENLPKHGPLIIAGNHVSALEAVILVAVVPRQVEFLGTGDIPFDPAYAWIANAYDLVRVNRGNIDRQALLACVDVLKQGAFLGIFPEGGIWDPAHMQAQTGIALVSERSGAPIVPVGFGGLQGALGAILKLKRPKICVNIGQLIPAVRLEEREMSQKDQLQQAANHILAQINDLLPENERQLANNDLQVSYALKIAAVTAQGSVTIPVSLALDAVNGFAHLLYTPVLLDALYRNLQLPILPLAKLDPVADPAGFKAALASISAYLQLNPGFFTYRFGMEEGLQVGRAVEQLQHLVDWADKADCTLQFVPEKHVLHMTSGELETHSGGDLPRSMLG